MNRVTIANRRRGGFMGRAVSVLALCAWAVLATAAIAGASAYQILLTASDTAPLAPNLDRWVRALPRTSDIIAADGTLLLSVPFNDRGVVGHRRHVDISELPEHVWRAILAAEDVRFLSHRGVDVRAVLRAALTNYRAGKIVEGASTITQQLARNMLPSQIGNQRSIARKLREALVARRIERRYSKSKILTAYAEFVFLGGGYYGLEAAAQGYFGRSANQLTIAQAAAIAGFIQSPSITDPRTNPTGALIRRGEVLGRMQKAGWIDTAAHRRAVAEPMTLTQRPPPLPAALAWHVEHVRRQFAHSGQLDRGDLIIGTTVEPSLALDLQNRADTHTAALGRSHKPAPQVAILLWNLHTEYVDAIIGGTSSEPSDWNRAVQACRQPGSAFKPVVYAAALQAGSITVATPVRDGPISAFDESLGIHWKPRTSAREFRGMVLAIDALAHSLNSAAVDVLDRVGYGRVIATARKLGIRSKLRRVRPLALGASCTTPLELLGAFRAFASDTGGSRPVFIKTVKQRGDVITDDRALVDGWLSPTDAIDVAVQVAATPPDRRIDPISSYLVREMLRAVTERGTGRAARRLGRDTAGKTGTTNDNTDAWFVGFTGRTLAAVWLGHDTPSLKLGRQQDGGRAALPMWVRAVRTVEGVLPPVAFSGPPPGVSLHAIDPKTGLLARHGGVELPFQEGTEPTEYSSSVDRQLRNYTDSLREF